MNNLQHAGRLERIRLFLADATSGSPKSNKYSTIQYIQTSDDGTPREADRLAAAVGRMTGMVLATGVDSAKEGFLCVGSWEQCWICSGLRLGSLGYDVGAMNGGDRGRVDFANCHGPSNVNGTALPCYTSAELL
jgi:hypothetical protein